MKNFKSLLIVLVFGLSIGMIVSCHNDENENTDRNLFTELRGTLLCDGIPMNPEPIPTVLFSSPGLGVCCFTLEFASPYDPFWEYGVMPIAGDSILYLHYQDGNLDMNRKTNVICIPWIADSIVVTIKNPATIGGIHCTALGNPCKS